MKNDEILKLYPIIVSDGVHDRNNLLSVTEHLEKKGCKFAMLGYQTKKSGYQYMIVRKWCKGEDFTLPSNKLFPTMETYKIDFEIIREWK